MHSLAYQMRTGCTPWPWLLQLQHHPACAATAWNPSDSDWASVCVLRETRRGMNLFQNTGYSRSKASCYQHHTPAQHPTEIPKASAFQEYGKHTKGTRGHQSINWLFKSAHSTCLAQKAGSGHYQPPVQDWYAQEDWFYRNSPSFSRETKPILLYYEHLVYTSKF